MTVFKKFSNSMYAVALLTMAFVALWNAKSPLSAYDTPALPRSFVIDKYLSATFQPSNPAYKPTWAALPLPQGLNKMTITDAGGASIPNLDCTIDNSVFILAYNMAYNNQTNKEVWYIMMKDSPLNRNSNEYSKQSYPIQIYGPYNGILPASFLAVPGDASYLWFTLPAIPTKRPFTTNVRIKMNLIPKTN